MVKQKENEKWKLCAMNVQLNYDRHNYLAPFRTCIVHDFANWNENEKQSSREMRENKNSTRAMAETERILGPRVWWQLAEKKKQKQ